MEEKNLVALPDKVADYLEFMKEKSYTLKGALVVKMSQNTSKQNLQRNFLKKITLVGCLIVMV